MLFNDTKCYSLVKSRICEVLMHWFCPLVYNNKSESFQLYDTIIFQWVPDFVGINHFCGYAIVN